MVVKRGLGKGGDNYLVVKGVGMAHDARRMFSRPSALVVALGTQRVEAAAKEYEMVRVRRWDLRNWGHVAVVCGLAFLVALAAGCRTGFRKLPESEVDPAMKSLAQHIGASMLESWRDGRFEPLGDDATSAMRSGLAPEGQREAYESVKGMFGDFQSMEYVETWAPTDGSLLLVFRFRGRFSRTRARPEIRVVLDGEKRLSGFWIKPWKAGMK